MTDRETPAGAVEALATEIDCFDCDGHGWTAQTTADPLPSGEPGEPYQVQCGCDTCGGTGRLPVTLTRSVDVERWQRIETAARLVARDLLTEAISFEDTAQRTTFAHLAALRDALGASDE